MIRLIGISGKIGSGKDTVARIIDSATTYTWRVKKFAGKVKDVANLLTGVPVSQFEDQEFKKQYMGDAWAMTYREFLQRIGTDAMRDNVHQNVWVNALFSDFDEKKSFWLITDVRFPNEAESIRARGGILIRVNRNSGNIVGTEHPSETALDNYQSFDYTVDNNGSIIDLEAKILNILTELNLLS